MAFQPNKPKGYKLKKLLCFMDKAKENFIKSFHNRDLFGRWIVV